MSDTILEPGYRYDPTAVDVAAALIDNVVTTRGGTDPRNTAQAIFDIFVHHGGLVEMTMTTDHTEIRNSADDDGPVLHHIPVHQCQRVSDDLDKQRVINRESYRLFIEAQDVSRTAVAEVKRLRKFIADEFILDVS